MNKPGYGVPRMSGAALWCGKPSLAQSLVKLVLAAV